MKCTYSFTSSVLFIHFTFSMCAKEDLNLQHRCLSQVIVALLYLATHICILRLLGRRLYLLCPFAQIGNDCKQIIITISLSRARESNHLIVITFLTVLRKTSAVILYSGPCGRNRTYVMSA